MIGRRATPFFLRLCASAVLALVLALAGGCSGPSVQPTPVQPPITPPPPPPPPPPNTPPTIGEIKASASRLEVGEEVEFAAMVTDADTPVEQLTYEWKAEKGTFSGTGSLVRWRAPQDDRTPSKYAATLTVIERYNALTPDDIEAREHKVTATSPSVNLNNSPKELSDLAWEFLNDFSNSQVSPETAVSRFSDNCRGKRDELEDIRYNRATYIILSATYSIRSVSIDRPRLSADIVAPCVFTSRIRATGATEIARGECLFTAVYEVNRWWLCESHFRGQTTSGLRFVF